MHRQCIRGKDTVILVKGYVPTAMEGRYESRNLKKNNRSSKSSFTNHRMHKKYCKEKHISFDYTKIKMTEKCRFYQPS